MQMTLARTTFRAQEHAPLLAEILTWVEPVKMRRAMGASLNELNALVEANLLVPRTQLPKIKRVWRRSDGLDLVAHLKPISQSISEQDQNWERLQIAKARSGLTVGDLIAAIWAGQLQIGARDGQSGYQSLCVHKEEVNNLADHASVLKQRDHPSAVQFGRSVGIRDKRRFSTLVEKGYTPATRMRHPNTGIWQYVMTEANMIAFHARFMTLTTMTEEFGGHRQIYLAALRSAGVPTFMPDGEDYGHLYLRSSVEPVLRKQRLID